MLSLLVKQGKPAGALVAAFIGRSLCMHFMSSPSIVQQIRLTEANCSMARKHSIQVSPSQEQTSPTALLQDMHKHEGPPQGYVELAERAKQCTYLHDFGLLKYVLALLILLGLLYSCLLGMAEPAEQQQLLRASWLTAGPPYIFPAQHGVAAHTVYVCHSVHARHKQAILLGPCRQVHAANTVVCAFVCS